MAVEVNYIQAVRLFLQHLKASNMTQRWLKSFERTFKGSFKRFIAGELIVYPLSLDKIKTTIIEPINIRAFVYKQLGNLWMFLPR